MLIGAMARMYAHRCDYRRSKAISGLDSSVSDVRVCSAFAIAKGGMGIDANCRAIIFKKLVAQYPTG